LAYPSGPTYAPRPPRNSQVALRIHIRACRNRATKNNAQGISARV